MNVLFTHAGSAVAFMHDFQYLPSTGETVYIYGKEYYVFERILDIQYKEEIDEKIITWEIQLATR